MRSSASPSASSVAKVLPDTGGVSFIPMLAATVGVQLVGSGVGAIVLVRRSS